MSKLSLIFMIKLKIREGILKRVIENNCSGRKEERRNQSGIASEAFWKWKKSTGKEGSETRRKGIHAGIKNNVAKWVEGEGAVERGEEGWKESETVSQRTSEGRSRAGEFEKVRVSGRTATTTFAPVQFSRHSFFFLIVRKSSVGKGALLKLRTN